MKILSKYKDYYDWEVSRFGIDDKMVLDRRQGFTDNEMAYENYDVIKIAICDFLYSGIYLNGKVLWEDEALELCEWSKWTKKYYIKDPEKRKFHYFGGIPFETKVPTEINQEENCPIVLVSERDNSNRSRFPNLKKYNIAGWYTSSEIFKDLYSWISKTKDKRTDIEKIDSHGFDKRKSFRNMKRDE